MTTTPTTTPTTTEYSPRTHYRELNFSRLPNYECFCNSNNSFGKCICFGIPKKQQTETETDKTPKKKITATRMTQTKKPQKKTFCKFCYNRRRPASEYKSHFTKSGPEFGAKVVCPLLLQQQCARCGEIGHTPKMCKSEHYLRSDERFPENPQYFEFSLFALERPHSWQHPIPPALQARHAAWVEENVKSSRVTIMMSGDHSRYTNDFYLSYGGPNWISFSRKPKTEYERNVELHYNWMRRNFQTDAQIQMKVDSWVGHMAAGTTTDADFISKESERGRLHTIGDDDWPIISKYNAAKAEILVAAGSGSGGGGVREFLGMQDIRAIIRKYVVANTAGAAGAASANNE